MDGCRSGIRVGVGVDCFVGGWVGVGWGGEGGCFVCVSGVGVGGLLPPTHICVWCHACPSERGMLLFFNPPNQPQQPTINPTPSRRGESDPVAIDDFSDGGEAMGNLTFIGHLTSIFLSLALVTYLYCVLGACVFRGMRA
jgi:hypothetical protein